MNILLNLLLTFMKIGAFSFGGGYVMIPLIQREVVEMHQWVTESMFIDMIAISQSTPGPIAVNTATFAGYQVGGIMGAAIATLGVTSVSFCLIVWITVKMASAKGNELVHCFFYGLRPAVVAMLAGVALKLGNVAIGDMFGGLIFIGVFIGVSKFKLHPLLGIIGSGILGIVLYA